MESRIHGSHPPPPPRARARRHPGPCVQRQGVGRAGGRDGGRPGRLGRPARAVPAHRRPAGRVRQGGPAAAARRGARALRAHGRRLRLRAGRPPRRRLGGARVAALSRRLPPVWLQLQFFSQLVACRRPRRGGAAASSACAMRSHAVTGRSGGGRCHEARMAGRGWQPWGRCRNATPDAHRRCGRRSPWW